MIFMMPYCQALEKLGLLGKFTSREEKEFLIERGRYMYACGEAPVEAAVQMFEVMIRKKLKLSPQKTRQIAEEGVVVIYCWIKSNELRKNEGENTAKHISAIATSL